MAQDSLLQVGATAALLAAAGYSLAYKASQAASPRLCRAYRSLAPPDRVDWDSRAPSTLHALLVSGLCLYALAFSGEFFQPGSTAPAPGQLPLVLRVSELSYAIIGTSFGYFAADAVLLACNPDISSAAMSIHHAISLLSLGVAAQVSSMHVYLLVTLLTELTTPFINARHWLDKAGAKGTRLYAANGLVICVVWALARLCPVVPVYASVVQNWHLVKGLPPHGLLLLLGVPLLLGALNALWFVKIVRGAAKLLRPQQRRTRAAAAAPAGEERSKPAAAARLGGQPVVKIHARAAGDSREHDD